MMLVQGPGASPGLWLLCPWGQAGLVHSRCSVQGNGALQNSLPVAGVSSAQLDGTSLMPLLPKGQQQNYMTLKEGPISWNSPSLSLSFSLLLSIGVPAGLRLSWQQNDRGPRSACPLLRLVIYPISHSRRPGCHSAGEMSRLY